MSFLVHLSQEEENVREKTIEKRLTDKINKMGGWALKFTSPGCAGLPDRLILMPGGRLWFVEVKAPGEKPRPLQLFRMKQIRNLGFPARVVDSPESVDEFLREVADSDL